MRNKQLVKSCCLLLLLGLSLMGLVFFVPVPNAASSRGFGFLSIALGTSWGNWLDLPAACCSFKIILFSLGLFLIIEAVGTLMAVMKCKVIAAAIYCLHCIPALGMVLGIFCEIKALL